MVDRTLTELFDQIKRCDRCSTEYPISREGDKCPHDGGNLVITHADKLIGSVLAERYTIRSLLGLGGWSSVYKADDQELKRSVAVKVLHSHLTNDPGRLKRFQAEALSVAGLNHPHISMVLDFGVLANGQPFIVMEYLEGKTLQQLIEKEDHLPHQRVVAIVQQICDALDHAHNKGLVHRDLKPGNVILLESDFVKLLDFGMAKYVDGLEHLTATGQTMGTPLYMSPEQCRGGEIDKRSDIYSLGVLVHYMLTGEEIFAATSTFEAMHKQLFEQPRALTETRSDLHFSGALQDVIMKAVEKEPSARFADCQEFKAAVQSAKFSHKSGSFNKPAGMPNQEQFVQKPALFTALGCMAVAIAAVWLATNFFQTKQPPAKVVLPEKPPVVAVAPSTEQPIPPGTWQAPLKSKQPTNYQGKPAPVNDPLARKLAAATNKAKEPAPTAVSVPVVMAQPKLLPKPDTTTPAETTPPVPPVRVKQDEFKGVRINSNEEAIAQLSKLSGCRVFRIVDCNFDDKVIEYIVDHFPTLRGLNVYSTPITDASMVFLARSQVGNLNLTKVNITDRGLAELKNASNLSVLTVRHCSVGDKGLKPLIACPITALHFLDASITDAAADSMRRMPQLRSIIVPGSNLGDAGLAKLVKLPLLRIDLTNTPVTDACGTSLAAMQSLKELSLSRTAIGDAAVEQLVGARQLARLDLTETNVTPEVVKSLERMESLKALRIDSKIVPAETLRKLNIEPIPDDEAVFTVAGRIRKTRRAQAD